MGKKRKKDIQIMISDHERLISDLNDAIEGKIRVTRYQMGRMICHYIPLPIGSWPTDSEINDPETRWLAMMGCMAETLSELNSLKEELAGMESKSDSLPLPMIPFFDNEVADDELRFVSSYVEWRCVR